MFPFAFTPDMLISKQPPDAYAFEELRLFDARKSNLIEMAETTDLSKYELITRPWEGGIGWDPRKKTWKEFENFIDKKYEQYQMLYRERSEQFLREQGYVKDKEKRNLEHFRWLVDYQIKGWSAREIADHYSSLKNEIINEDTVLHGIKNTASLVLIHLRSSKNK